MKKLFLMVFIIGMLASCGHHRYSTDGAQGYVYTVVSSNTASVTQPEMPEFEAKAPLTVGPVVSIPNATAFRMTGDYANNVGITLDANGNLLYFPDPKDITADSEPISLGGGWWLNRQGIGQNSVFTSYTFAEYAALPQVPSPQQLKNSIIPGARVTDFIELPVKLNESMSNLPFIKEYLNGR